MKSSEAEFLAIAAYEASVREVMTAPKPGLVDSEGSGCHDDMDCALFLKSARALAPFWIRQARAGLDGTPPELAAARLRAAGVEMERAMAEATGGVNTHKGLVYLMSLLLYGAGFALFSGAPRSAEAAAGFAARERMICGCGGIGCRGPRRGVGGVGVGAGPFRRCGVPQGVVRKPEPDRTGGDAAQYDLCEQQYDCRR